MIGEDSNSKIGQPEALHSFKLSTNRNGQVLCDLMVQHGLIVLNTRFRKSKKKLWTFMYTNGEKAQLQE